MQLAVSSSTVASPAACAGTQSADAHSAAKSASHARRKKAAGIEDFSIDAQQDSGSAAKQRSGDDGERSELTRVSRQARARRTQQVNIQQVQRVGRTFLWRTGMTTLQSPIHKE
jgi:exo-beta-1,3-glucanase (GH17 family)